MADIESVRVGREQEKNDVGAPHEPLADHGHAMVADDFPTDEELVTLRRVSDKIPWKIITIAFVELCERFSYYGTTAVFTNYIQWPRPEGSATGANCRDPSSPSCSELVLSRLLTKR